MQTAPTARRRALRWLDPLAAGALGVCAAGLVSTPWTCHVSLLERLTHFRLYWLGGLIALVGWWALRLAWKRAAVSAVLLAWGAAGVIPYWQRSAAPAPAAGRELTFVSFNLLASNQQHEAVLRWLEAQPADFVLLTEYSKRWQRVFRGRAQAWPHRLEFLRDATSGICLLSRHPLGAPVAEGVALAEKRPWICTVARTPVGDVRVLGLHPRTPRGGSRIDERNAQLATAARLAAASAEPFVLLGDLNCTPFSPCFTGMLETGNLRDSAVGYGLAPTWHSGIWWLPIDHILISPHWHVVARHVAPIDLGSDHFPVSATLSLR